VAQEQGEKDRYNYNAYSPDGDLGHNGFLSLPLWRVCSQCHRGAGKLGRMTGAHLQRGAKLPEVRRLHARAVLHKKREKNLQRGITRRSGLASD
jgi:hypothetical protein